MAAQAERRSALKPRAAKNKRGANFYRQALREALKKRADLNRAKSLLEKARSAGSAEAAYALGNWYLHGEVFEKNPIKAVPLLKEAAQQNVPDALANLAICYEKGIGAKKNDQRALEYYLRAALHGNNQSFYEVGRCYYYGIGTAKDRRVARAWLDRAAELGVPDRR